MKKNNKNGHIDNANNLDRMISICKGYNEQYNPPYSVLETAALEQMSADAKAKLNGLTLKEIAYNKATNDRELIFKDVKKLCTRIVLAAKSSRVTPLHYQDLVSIKNKINGVRKQNKVTTTLTSTDKGLVLNNMDSSSKTNSINTTTVANNNGIISKKSNNTAQLSFDRLSDNFGKLIEVIKATPEYKPNEVDLKLDSLQEKSDLLKLANQTVLESLVDITKARKDRNQFFYLKENNLVDTAMAVKNYTRSVFGARSVQNKQLTNLSFRKYKR